MPPPIPLPVSPQFSSSTPNEYVDALLEFSSDPLLRVLCGGVHILDFFMRDSSSEATPQDIYRTVLSAEWISYFDTISIEQTLDLLLRTPLESFDPEVPGSLRSYIQKVREHSLQRDFIRRTASERTKKKVGYGTEWALNSGMKPKKIHEVENFAAFLDDLVRDIQGLDAETGGKGVSHVVDYGSGQAYLCRTVAKKYGHNVVGIESRTVNINGAIALDNAFDKIATKKLNFKLRNKNQPQQVCENGKSATDPEQHVTGTLQYVQTFITDGNLDEVVDAIHDLAEPPLSNNESALEAPEIRPKPPKSLLLTSLHSCGNLVHHALTAFSRTPSVRAVALIGCCYNLMTEKHGMTFKPPYLRSPHPRLIATSTAGDPQGFPISASFTEMDIQLNITARSIACQAPSNWTTESSTDFFLRHFYRALLQRIFLDKGMVDPTSSNPIIIGSLKKQSYNSFFEYVTAGIKKLGWEDRVVVTREEVDEYMRRFGHRKKELSIVWSLMAFSAAVIESIIVVDRWLFLKEMGCSRAWVEAAFEHGESPRNFVVVGVR